MTDNDNDNKSDYMILCINQFDRLETYNKYKEFINNLHNGKKQKKYRRWLQYVLTSVSKAKLNNNLVDEYTLQDLIDAKIKPYFDIEEDEYEVINKFGRGLFDEHSITSGFCSKDQNIIIEIAKGYGAFNY
jgi:hypothetical protein